MNPQYAIPVLVGMSVFAVGGAILLGRWARRASLRGRLQGIGGEISGSMALAPSPGAPRLTNVIGNIGTAMSSGRTSVSLREQLTQAGYHQAGAAAVFLGAKMLLIFVGLVASSALVISTSLPLNIKMLIVGGSAVILFFVPNMVVALHRSKRCGEIRRHLPDAIDLLEVCASAGMGMDMAWNSVAEEVRSVSPILADEMALTNLEIHLGASRAEAMRHMSKRTGAEELTSMVAVLVQSERFGTSIAESLRVFATTMREARSQNAQESAEKMSVKLIFPMVVFIFPAVVMVMAGPAFISLYRVFAPR